MVHWHNVSGPINGTLNDENVASALDCRSSTTHMTT